MKDSAEVSTTKLLLIILTLLGVAASAFGNVKVTVGAVLEMEQVEANIHGDTATVAGEFHFRRFTMPARGGGNDAQVFFPLVCAKDRSNSLESFQFELELNGKKPDSYSIVTNAPVAVPASDAYSIVWVVARVPAGAVNRWTVKVSYRQELVNGVFYYLPILDNARPAPDGFQIRVASDRPIHPVGKSPGGVMAKGPRELIFNPSNLGMIGVSANAASSAKDDNSKPAAK